MGVYTFICKSSGGSWTAKQYSGDLEGSADSTYDLQRSLVSEAQKAEEGPVQSSFSYVTPSSAVFQVIIGGAVVGGGLIGGGAGAAPAAGGAAAAPTEEKKEEKEEKEESDEDMGFSLFD
eukprot:TRINITY_DN29480_c0_g1_i1.p1 TRINITY_DN29480_c0_g1~~TRINITY_DN29480_c0_g1_i1.p1  ORF type:complete len:120 (-),score=26.26 TRINITY_DN29480_c0_g1_i1:438-797(-)